MTSTSPNSRDDASDGFLHKLKNHLSWGKGHLRQNLRELFGCSTFDETVREDLEARLLLAIARELGLPVRFLGTGEGVGDLEPFDARDFTDVLLGEVTE